MKNKRRIVIIIFVVIIALISAGAIIYRLLQDENKLTVTEKKYITDSASNLFTITIDNDLNVFGNAGEGVFYDYLTDFETNYNLKFSIIANSTGKSAEGLALTKNTVVPDNAKVIYTDHYVLVGKTYSVISNPKYISGTIGTLNKDTTLFSKYLGDYSLTYKNYETKSELLDGLTNDEVSYMIVPMYEYLDFTLSNLYFIDYHFSDIKDYYYLQFNDDELLSSIMKKYLNIWNENSMEDSINTNKYDLFTSKLKLTEKELDVIDSKIYNYAFVNSAPYDHKASNNYGGIMSVILNKFSEFSGIKFNYTEYSKYSKFTKAINNNTVNLFVNYYDFTPSATSLDSLLTIDYSIVMNNTDFRVFNSLESLKNTEVFVKENSTAIKYLTSNGLTIKTYKNETELKKLLKNNEIIIMDKMSYVAIKDEGNMNFSERAVINSNTTYNFVSNNDTMFNRLFSYYVSTIDKNEILYTGLNDYHNNIKAGTIIYKITKYAFILVLGIALITFAIYKYSKRVHIRKKIKKADKMKYIDMLTSLKNRNFLTENLPIWNQNTIYPQSIIVIDLNGIQELNDSYGYSEGDKQIQSVANVLIKTQLDNSEVIRTDGNEFTVYLVGYSEKQVLSYIKKLNKEFKNLPHDKGAAIGFSMINDDLKLIDDAINEATELMKKNKELTQGESDENKI